MQDREELVHDELNLVNEVTTSYVDLCATLRQEKEEIAEELT